MARMIDEWGPSSTVTDSWKEHFCDAKLPNSHSLTSSHSRQYEHLAHQNRYFCFARFTCPFVEPLGPSPFRPYFCARSLICPSVLYPVVLWNSTVWFLGRDAVSTCFWWLTAPSLPLPFTPFLLSVWVCVSYMECCRLTHLCLFLWHRWMVPSPLVSSIHSMEPSWFPVVRIITSITYCAILVILINRSSEVQNVDFVLRSNLIPTRIRSLLTWALCLVLSASCISLFVVSLRKSVYANVCRRSALHSRLTWWGTPRCWTLLVSPFLAWWTSCLVPLLPFFVPF